MENGVRFRFRPAFASGKLEDGPQLVAVLSLRRTLGTLDLMANSLYEKTLDMSCADSCRLLGVWFHVRIRVQQQAISS